VEAEPLLRRALAIAEQSFGPEHPEVAIQLNNLAGLLYSANRLEEAEPLMRRHLIIFAKFTVAAKREHPHLRAAENYRMVLMEAGQMPEQAKHGMFSALREGGLSPRG
jgi:Tetratricopeptide repeat